MADAPKIFSAGSCSAQKSEKICRATFLIDRADFEIILQRITALTCLFNLHSETFSRWSVRQLGIRKRKALVPEYYLMFVKRKKILSDCFTGPSNPSSTSKNSKADSEKEEEATSGEDDDSDAESWHSFESEYDDARSVIPEEELEEETSETRYMISDKLIFKFFLLSKLYVRR